MAFLPVFFALLPFLPALNPVPGVDLASARLVVAIAAVALLIRALVRGRVVLSMPLSVLLLHTFVMFLALTFFWSADGTTTLRKSVFLLGLLPGTWLVLKSSAAQRSALLEAFVSGAALAALAALAVQGALFLFPDSGIGPLVPVLSWRLGAQTAEAVTQFPSWFVNIAGSTVPRATFPFPNPHMAVLYWMLALPFAVRSGRFPARRAVLLLAVLLSFTRSGYILLALQIPLLVMLATRVRAARPAVRITFPRLWGTVFGGAATLFVLPLAVGRFLGSFDFAEGSLTGRLGLWSDTARIAAAAPVLGIGFGGLAGALEPLAGYRVPTNAHSTYLELLAETGVVGTALFLTALGTALFFAVREWKNGSSLHGAVVIALLTFAVHGVFETNIFGVETTIVLFALLALATAQKNQTAWKSS
jgi:hypothetical protein